MEYSIVNVNGRASYTAVPRRPKRGNQMALVIAAVVLLVWGPLQIPFLVKTTHQSVISSNGKYNNSAYSYQDVVGSMSNRERNGVKYASVRLSPESNGAVFHVLASKRLDGVVVLLDGCGGTIDRLLSPAGETVLQAAGRAHYLPVTVEFPGDAAGRCPSRISPNIVIADLVASINHLVQLSGTVGLPLVFAGVGDGVPFAGMAQVLRMMQVSRKAENGGAVELTAGIVYGTHIPVQLNQMWTGILGVQATVHVVLITPPTSSADVADQDNVAREDAALVARGVTVQRIARDCDECMLLPGGYPAMDATSLHDALRRVSFKLRKIP